MLPEMKISFLEKCLIQTFYERPKTIREVVETTNFDRIFVVRGITGLQEDGVVEEGEYKVLREPTDTVKGLRSRTYRLTSAWREMYSTLNAEIDEDKS
ncbi:MAG: hypothetical protein IH934_03210 [Nanoarchaeota archaeon]|nr:hypothetical protein [Nanoarchaeota archaeon]